MRCVSVWKARTAAKASSLERLFFDVDDADTIMVKRYRLVLPGEEQ